jgi:hypothetical protein
VIHPDEYEKRLLRFLLDKVFIDSKQTLDQLLADSNNIPKSLTDNDQQRFEKQTTDIFIESTSF